MALSLRSGNPAGDGECSKKKYKVGRKRIVGINTPYKMLSILGKNEILVGSADLQITQRGSDGGGDPQVDR